MAEPDNDSLLLSQLPDVQPSDSEEVARSLKLARMLWEEGQRREAVRTLQRGAAAAEEAGDDLRALKLARTAADLATHVDMSSAPPPPPLDIADDDETSVSVDFDTDPEPSENPPPSAPPTTRSVTPSPSSVTPSPPNVVPAASSVVPAASSVVPSNAPTTGSVPPAVNGTSTASTSTRSFPRPGTHSETPARASASPAAAERQSTKPGLKPANGAAVPTFDVAAREVRVSVKRSTLDETLFVVRPLAPGAKAPPGAREATLVFSDVDPE